MAEDRFYFDIIGNIMRQAVIDTNVLVAGLRSARGASFLLLEAWTMGLFHPIVSTALWLEYEDVLKREDLQPLDHAQVDTLLANLARNCRPTRIHLRWRPQLRDPGDELVLEAAINGRAGAIVSFNRRDFLPAATRFGIVIMSPAQYLEEVLT